MCMLNFCMAQWLSMFYDLIYTMESRLKWCLKCTCMYVCMFDPAVCEMVMSKEEIVVLKYFFAGGFTQFMHVHVYLSPIYSVSCP